MLINLERLILGTWRCAGLPSFASLHERLGFYPSHGHSELFRVCTIAAPQEPTGSGAGAPQHPQGQEQVLDMSKLTCRGCPLTLGDVAKHASIAEKLLFQGKGE